LGAEGYGLWITVSSAAVMFFAFDMGIASTLTNLISEAYAANDRVLAARYFATAFWLVLAIAVVLGIVGWAVWPQIHWAAVFHVRSVALVRETPRAMAAAFIVFLLSLPAGLAAKVLGGYQELHASNLFAAAGSVLSLVVVIGVILLHGTLPVLVGGFAGSAVAANFACLAWICFFHKPWIKPWPSRVNLHWVKKIFGSGSQFFAIQLAGLIIFSSDNIVISHYLGPARVTPYAVTWRLAGYIAAVQALVIPSLWPAYSEAYAKGDLGWIRSAYDRVRWLSIAALAAGCSTLLLGGRQIIRLWAGPGAVPDSLLLQLMCVWIVICVFATNQSTLMGATFRVRRQAIASLISSLVNLALSILWIRKIGPVGVLLATIVSYLVFICGPQTWEVRRILRGDFLGSRELHSPASVMFE
jgi:O-antigen/teichoic acid export membrane protein